MGSGKSSHRGLKICCGVTAILFIIVLVVLVVLFLTILKPKEPKIITQPVTLENIEFGVFPLLKLNVSLGIVVTIENRNYGSFKYKDSTAYMTYRGTVVAEAPIEHDTIPARGEHNISTSVEIIADKLMQNPYFMVDIGSGSLNFTSSTTLYGKVTIFKFVKLKATTFSNCYISVFILGQSIDSVCTSRVKF